MPGESIVVTTVEVQSRDGSPEAPRPITEAVRGVLKQCLRPDKDVLLPNLGGAGESGLVFAIASMQEDGGEIIGKRILSQLKQHEELQTDDFHFAIAHSFLPPMVRFANESMDMYVEQVAAGIQNHINKIVLQGKV